MRTGLHCNTTRDQAKLLDYYQRSGANVIKVMEFDPNLLSQLKARGITIIGRVYDDDQSTAGTKSGDFIARVVQHARDFPQVDYWEGYNEAFSDGNDMNRYADIEIRRMQALESLSPSRKAIIACFSTGTPEDVDWPRFRPALEYAHAHGHALGLHEYSGPFMQWLAGENQWDHARGTPIRIDDPCLSPTVEGWLTLRYRKAYQLFRQWGIGDLPLFITEGGIDDVQPRPGPQGKGYKDFAGTEWARLPGIGDYAEQRRWYMWQVSHDRYVKGVVDFGWDTADPSWRSFDLSTDVAMRDRIIQLESTLPVGYIETTEPVPGPLPPSEQPVPVPPIGIAAPGLLPMILMESGWSLLDAAVRAFPEEQDLRKQQAHAEAIARLNGLDVALVRNPDPRILLPRYLAVPGHIVVRYDPTPQSPRPTR